ncbi:RDD family protein [Herbiconiux sp. P16]|uniref:RDD family protein n=1 Tax=Herbiconiux wuyangfengii TaxID=3342794 RepID=UPI0035B9B2C2
MTDASNTIPCVRCGSPMPRSAQFCLACGTPVSSRTQAVALGEGGAGGSGAAPAAVADSAAWLPTPVAEPMLASTVVASHYGRRVVAFLIDGAIGSAIWLVAVLPLIGLGAIEVDAPSGSFRASGLSAVVVLFVGLLYPVVLWVLQAFLGLTPGKASMGLRIVRRTTLARAGIGRILLRALVVFAGSLVLGIGQLVVYLSPLWDSRRIGQGWQDKAADTWVIDVRRGPNPLKAGPGQLVFDVAPGSVAALPAAAAAGSGVPSSAGFAPSAPGSAPVPSSAGFAPPAADSAATSAPARFGAPATGAATSPAAATPAEPVAPLTVASAFPGFTDPPPVISPFAVRAEPVIESIPGFEPPPVVPVTESGPLPPAAAPPAPPAAPAVPATPPAGSGPSAVTPPAAQPAAPDAAPPADGDADLDSTRLSDSARPITAAPGAVSFRLDSGEIFPIHGHGVLGRDPVPQSSAAIVIRMPGDTLSISKTHLEFGLDGGSAWVSDRGSTNGSAIERADGTTLPLTPGERVAVASGDRVSVGTRSFGVDGGGAA